MKLGLLVVVVVLVLVPAIAACTAQVPSPSPVPSSSMASSAPIACALRADCPHANAVCWDVVCGADGFCSSEPAPWYEGLPEWWNPGPCTRVQCDGLGGVVYAPIAAGVACIVARTGASSTCDGTGECQ